MYSQTEVEEAVAAGALSRDDAESLRHFVEQRDHQSLIDDEQFRLIASFNDIFVAIALLISFFALGAMLGGTALIAIPVLGWALSPLFIERRKMALPAIIIVASMSIAGGLFGEGGALVAALVMAVHYYRFRVPITPALIGGSLLAAFLSLAPLGGTPQRTLWVFLLFGLAMFAVAMRYDMSDRYRRTYRSDVAFWLHLGASAATIHSFFWLSGLLALKMSGAQIAGVLGVYTLLALVALVIDRRPVLVSGLAYALWATGSLVVQQGRSFEILPLLLAVAASALLLLAANWHRARNALVRQLPEQWQDRLPAIGPQPASPQPAA